MLGLSRRRHHLSSHVPEAIVALTVLISSAAPPSTAVFPVLYIGPDQVLPFTSFVGAAIGVVLMFWNRLVGVFRRMRKPSSEK
jgi:hypothetical protein